MFLFPQISVAFSLHQRHFFPQIETSVEIHNLLKFREKQTEGNYLSYFFISVIGYFTGEINVFGLTASEVQRP